MKTKTTNPTKIGENTNKRNFFQKIFILLAILAFTSFGFKVKAQTFTVAVDNSSSCTWTIRVYDNTSTLLNTTPYVSNGGSNYVLFGCDNGVPDYITVSKPGLGCTTITFGSAGLFPYTSITPPCCNPTMTCAGGNGNGFCSPGTGDIHILIQIL